MCTKFWLKTTWEDINYEVQNGSMELGEIGCEDFDCTEWSWYTPSDALFSMTVMKRRVTQWGISSSGLIIL